MDILSIFTDLGSSFGTISGPMNRVFDIKSGHDFSRYRNSIQVICFQINVWHFGSSFTVRYVISFDFSLLTDKNLHECSSVEAAHIYSYKHSTLFAEDGLTLERESICQPPKPSECNYSPSIFSTCVRVLTEKSESF